MNIKFLSSILLSMVLLSSPSFATTAEGFATPEYLRNNGYSNSMVDMVEYSKASSVGEKYINQEEVDHMYDTKFKTIVRKFFKYFDPAVDDGKFLDHDIKLSPSPNDL